MTPNGLDLAEIDPRKGAKYSPNLFRWLSTKNRSRAHRATSSRVYRGGLDDSLWIGYVDDEGALIGTRLTSVLSYGAKADTAWWASLGKVAEVEDFWPRYIRDGRCAVDPNHEHHFVGDESRWLAVGKTRRTCTWCEAKPTQVLKRWTEKVQREAWVPQLPPGAIL